MNLPQIDDLDRPVWGAEAFGQIINRDVTHVFYMLNNGLLDADKIGRRWVSTPRRLLGQFNGQRRTVG
jgi:hypothetical protein